MAQPQTYKNHSRFDPLFHFFIAIVLLANIVVTAIWYGHHRFTNARSGPWAILVAIVLFLLALKARMYALKNQDRIIRVEERLRIATVVPPAELAELDSLTMRQYIALRFASNPELPDLARRAVREKLTEKQIKEAIKSWRADNDRV
ncbi:MAG: DUF6526 family protein [Acidobacteriota bacterium]